MNVKETMRTISKYCWPNIEEPASLYVLSMEALILNHDAYRESIKTFPRFMKSMMLRKMTKTGYLPKDAMKLLANEDIDSIDLSSCDITDEDLDALHICSKLYKLNMTPPREEPRDIITTSALTRLWPSVTGLRVLLLRKCPAVTDEVVASIAQNCPHIRELDLGYCASITNVSMEAIAESLEHLWSVCLSGTQVTDDGVASLVEGKCAQSISEIIVNDCKNLTDVSIDLISKNCPRLKIIVFRGCNINGDVFNAFSMHLLETVVKPAHLNNFSRNALYLNNILFVAHSCKTPFSTISTTELNSGRWRGQFISSEKGFCICKEDNKINFMSSSSPYMTKRRLLTSHCQRSTVHKMNYLEKFLNISQYQKMICLYSVASSFLGY